MTVSLTFSLCVSLLFSQGLSVSVSPRLCVCLSQSRLHLSLFVPLPRLSQASAPLTGQSQLAPQPAPPVPRSLQAGKLRPTGGHSREGGLGLAAATFTRTVPFAPAASGFAGHGWGEGVPGTMSQRLGMDRRCAPREGTAWDTQAGSHPRVAS